VRYAPVLALALLAGCAPHPGNAPVDFPNTLRARRAIWAAIQPLATERGIDPLFVYAIVRIESNFDPHASRGLARGLLQIKPRAWMAVSTIPYEPAVWAWRVNLSVGIDSLASIKGALQARGVFSYPMLWAAYHYGLGYVEAHGFDLDRIPRPPDPVSRRLWSGDVHPIAAPK
jgi:soluble lytic murein transglycosylase-like protein